MKLKSIVIGGVMVLCAGLAVFGLIKLHTDSGGDPDDQPQEENVTPVINVQTGAVQRVTLHEYVNTYGTIEPAPATAGEPSAGGPLSAPSAGVVARVAVVAGQHVNKDDVLVELNSSTATFDYAKAEVERQRKLFADQNTSAKNLADAEAQLASLQLIAPISGTVTRVAVRAGQAVDANTVLAEVVDLNRLAVSASVPAANASQLKTNLEVQVLTDPPVTTSLHFISPSIEAADGTVLTHSLLPADSGLRPGQFVELRIVTAVHTNCLAVPEQSVVTGDDNKSFIVLVNGNEAAQKPVTTGLRENGLVEIEAPDLKEGDSVVTTGAYGFPDKAKVSIGNSAENYAAESPTNSAPEK